MTEGKSLAEAILDEQQRCRDLLKAYAELGSVGMFGHMMISGVLRRTEAAVMAGDTVEMMRCYEELKECQ